MEAAISPPNMASRPISTSRLDRIAMTLSGLCAVHCVATAVLLGLLASAGGMLGQPIIHEIGLSLAIMAYAMSLHESGFEPAITILGVSVLALGHRLNMTAKQPGV